MVGGAKLMMPTFTVLVMALPSGPVAVICLSMMWYGANSGLPRLDAVDVGQHLRERGAGAARFGWRRTLSTSKLVARHLAQERQAVVEFVVADAAAVHLQHIHRLVDGQGLVAGQRFYQCLVVGQRRALDGVAVVEQQVVRELCARLGDQGRRAFQADRRLRLQLVVIITEHIRVQVRRLQQGQGGAAAGRRGRWLDRPSGGGRQGAAAGQQQRQQGKTGRLKHDVFLWKDNIASIIRSTAAIYQGKNIVANTAK